MLNSAGNIFYHGKAWSDRKHFEYKAKLHGHEAPEYPKIRRKRTNDQEIFGCINEKIRRVFKYAISYSQGL